MVHEIRPFSVEKPRSRAVYFPRAISSRTKGDCSAAANGGFSAKQVVTFPDGKRICLQAINQCQQVYSAAAIGAIEARFTEDDQVF